MSDRVSLLPHLRIDERSCDLRHILLGRPTLSIKRRFLITLLILIKKKKLIIILNNNLFFRRFKIIYIISFITEAGFNVQYPFSYCVVFNLY